MTATVSNAYWHSTRVITFALLTATSFLTVAVIWFARELNQWTAGGAPVGFLMASLGCLLAYLLCIMGYVRRMNALERRLASTRKADLPHHAERHAQA